MVGRKLLLIGAIAIATLCGGAAAAEILIGVAGPMTGKNAWFGEQIERGTALAVADINAAGGMLGPAGRADHGGRLLRSRAGGRRCQEVGQ
jgi:hypothetical protein